MNVLLVDDEIIVLELLKETVMKVLPQANSVSFASSRDALEYAEHHPIDIAVLDINMRIIDGVTMARKLQSLYPKINIIFCTGYSEYMKDAFDLYCSGYLFKPVTEEKIRQAVEHLRYPVQPAAKRVAIQCFGNFEVFVNGMPVKFKYNRTKELLAYLVDRNGTDCSTLELIAVLFGDDVNRSYFNHLRRDLIDTFTDLGVNDILRTKRGRLGINRETVDCDYFDYLDGKRSDKPEEYMAQYSFMY